MVPTDKAAELAVAFGAQAAAAIALAIAAAAGPAAPFFVAASAGLEGGAQLAANAAQDPPEPDPKLLEAVVPAQPVRVNASGGEGAQQNLATATARTHQILACAIALNQIHGRLRGAADAKSDQGLKLQAQSYRTTLSQLLHDTKQLTDLEATTLNSLEAEGQSLSPV